MMILKPRIFSLFILQKPSLSANFGMLTDKLTEKQNKKAQDDFKRQIQHMSNKPSFTLMDYRQRIIDELNNLKTSFRKNLSKEAQDMQKNLQEQKKVMNSLFENELVGEENVTFHIRKQIALVTGLDIEKVNEVFKKADSYKKMHKYLRAVNRVGQALPESMNQLQIKFQKSKHAYIGKQKRHLKYKIENRRCKGSLRAMRIRYFKFNKD